MKKLLLLLAASSLAFGQAPKMGFGSSTTGWSYFGAGAAFEGTNWWVEFSPHWQIAVTADAATDRLDSTPYTPTGDETIWAGGAPFAGVYLDATTMPSGLFPKFNTLGGTYAVCNISGNTFELHRGFQNTINTAGTLGTVTGGNAVDLTANLVVGGVAIIAGSPFTIASTPTPTTFTTTTSMGTQTSVSFWSKCAGVWEKFTTNGTAVTMNWDPQTDIFIDSVTGLPAGATVTWYQTESGGIVGAQPTSGGKPYLFHGNGIVTARIAIPASTAGSYSPVFKAAQDASGTNLTSTTVPLTVQTFTPLTHTVPTSAPTIPGLSTFLSTAVSAGGGGNWGNKTTGVTNPATLGFGDESQIWYYDGSRVYYQIADFSGDSQWNNVANNIATQYQGYLNPSMSNTPGYRVFPNGLGIAAARLSDASFCTTMENFPLITGTLFVHYGGRVNDDIQRETAYALDTYVALVNLCGQSLNPNAGRTAELLMGQLTAYTEGGTYSLFQAFYAGLAMEALIEYNELVPDSRIPVVIKRTLDKMYSQYDGTTHVMPYNPYGIGPFCATLNENNWFMTIGGDPLFTGCNDPTLTALKVLNNLYAPAWAYIWSYTADSTYQTQGDELFSHTLDGGNPFNGKQFSQVYKWGPKYVTWRNTTAPAASGSVLSGRVTISGKITIH